MLIDIETPQVIGIDFQENNNVPISQPSTNM